MHLGNGAITPECGLVALGIAGSAAALAYATARATGVERAQARMAGALGAWVFAVQMFNLPITPYSSLHLIGGTLLAWMLGPALGLLLMAVVLTAQAVLLADGGLLTLGVNVFNMGCLPAAMVALVRPRVANSSQAVQAAALALASFTATVAGAACITLEVAVGRAGLEGWTTFAGQMLASHALAGLLEAGGAVLAVWALRGFEPVADQGSFVSMPILTGVAVASVAVALVSAPGMGWCSTAPDAYHAALDSFTGGSGSLESPDGLNGLAALAYSAQHSTADLLSRLDGLSGCTSGLRVSGLAATALTGALGCCIASLCGRRRVACIAQP